MHEEAADESGAVPTSPDPGMHLELKEMRRDVRVATISSWAANFGSSLESDFEIDKLEDDLTGTTNDGYSASFAFELVLSLSYEKSITMDTYLGRIRREFMRREKAWTKLGNDRLDEGDEDGPRAWDDLAATDKIHVLWRLCEWHLVDPERFRNRLDMNGDNGIWRDEPLCHDAAGNAYWYFYDGRLWAQRGARPAFVKPQKRIKRKAESRARRKSETQEASAPPAKKAKITRSAAQAITKSKAPPSAQSGQSKERVPRQGIRGSRRLGTAVEDGWQAIPEEWLSPDKSVHGKVKVANGLKSKRGKGRVAHAVPDTRESSPLSSLSSHTSSRSQSAVPSQSMNAGLDCSVEGSSKDMSSDAEDNDDEPIAIEFVPALSPTDPEWAEWEVICSTEDDWRILQAKLALSPRPRDRELGSLIDDEIVPRMKAAVEERAERERLAAEEQERAEAEEAARIAAIEEPATRKRSSRIAMRENEMLERQRLEWELEGAERVLRGGRVTRRGLFKPTYDDTRQGRLQRREDERKEREMERALRESRRAAGEATDEDDERAPWETGTSEEPLDADSVGPVSEPEELKSIMEVDGDLVKSEESSLHLVEPIEDDAPHKLPDADETASLSKPETTHLSAPQPSLKVILRRSPSLSAISDAETRALRSASAELPSMMADELPPLEQATNGETGSDAVIMDISHTKTKEAATASTDHIFGGMPTTVAGDPQVPEEDGVMEADTTVATPLAVQAGAPASTGTNVEKSVLRTDAVAVVATPSQPLPLRSEMGAASSQGASPNSTSPASTPSSSPNGRLRLPLNLPAAVFAQGIGAGPVKTRSRALKGSMSQYTGSHAPPNASAAATSVYAPVAAASTSQPAQYAEAGNIGADGVPRTATQIPPLGSRSGPPSLLGAVAYTHPTVKPVHHLSSAARHANFSSPWTQPYASLFSSIRGSSSTGPIEANLPSSMPSFWPSRAPISQGAWPSEQDRFQTVMAPRPAPMSTGFDRRPYLGGWQPHGIGPLPGRDHVPYSGMLHTPWTNGSSYHTVSGSVPARSPSATQSKEPNDTRKNA